MNWPCPITGGAVTRMSAASFARACKSRKDTKDNNTCKACRGRKDHWPPELEIREENMGKTTSKEQITNALAPLKAKADMVDRLAEIMGCEPDGLVEAMELMQGHVQTIRDIVEPEVAIHNPADLPDACRMLADMYHAARDTYMEKCNMVAALEAELAACRADAPAGDRGAECLDVGAAVYRDALADFGASVLAGRVLVTFRDAP